MVDTTLVIWLVLVVGILIIGLFGAFGLYRKFKALVYDVYDRRSQRHIKYYAIIDKGDKSIKYYSNLLTPWHARKVPLVYDPWSYADINKRVQLIRSPTGKPGDETDVPCGLPLNSQSAAMEYAEMLSNSLATMMPFYDKIKALDLRVGEKGKIDIKKKSTIYHFPATIKKIDANGVLIEYLNDEKPHTMVLTGDMVEEFKSTTPKEEKKHLDPISHSDFVNENYVMVRFGIRKVEDANIITIPTKIAIATFINSNNEFIKEGQGLIQKYGPLMIGCILVFICGITAYIIITGNGNFQQQMTQTLESYQQHLGLPALTSSGNTIASTTTAPPGPSYPVSIGGT